jgi:hypothetical protein
LAWNKEYLLASWVGTGRMLKVQEQDQDTSLCFYGESCTLPRQAKSSLSQHKSAFVFSLPYTLHLLVTGFISQCSVVLVLARPPSAISELWWERVIAITSVLMPPGLTPHAPAPYSWYLPQNSCGGRAVWKPSSAGYRCQHLQIPKLIWGREEIYGKLYEAPQLSNRKLNLTVWITSSLH